MSKKLYKCGLMASAGVVSGRNGLQNLVMFHLWYRMVLIGLK